MSKPTKRVTDGIVITYQLTEDRAKRFNDLIGAFVIAALTEPYPREYINPDKGDFITLSMNSDKLDV